MSHALWAVYSEARSINIGRFGRNSMKVETMNDENTNLYEMKCVQKCANVKKRCKMITEW